MNSSLPFLHGFTFVTAACQPQEEMLAFPPAEMGYSFNKKNIVTVSYQIKNQGRAQ